MKTDKHQHCQVLLPTRNRWIHSSKIYVLLVWIVALAGVSVRTAAETEDSDERRFGHFRTRPSVGDVLVWNGREYVPQSKGVLELRDYAHAGVDCTGATDSSTALNYLTSTADTVTGTTISGRGCPMLRLDSTWLIHGQEFLEVDLGSKGQGGTTGGNPGSAGRIQGGTVIFGCNGAAGPLIQWDRSGYGKFHGGTLATRGGSGGSNAWCASNFTESIRTTNSGSGGYTSTANQFYDLVLTTSATGGVPQTNFIGFRIEGTPNQENYRLQNVTIFCNGSTGSKGFYSTDGNADSTTWDGGGVNGCYRMIQMDAGYLRLLHTNNSYNGTYSIFGPGGASIGQSRGCVGDIVGNVFAEGSGTLIRSGTGGAFGCNNYLRGNAATPGDIDPSVHFIELGLQVGTLSLEHNAFSIGHSPAILDNAIAGSVAAGGTGRVQVLDKGGNGLTNAAAHAYKLNN